MFSKSCQYAINAMIFLAAMPADQERVGLKEIAQGIDSPLAFTAKVLQILVKANLLVSIKGPHGGFQIEDRVRKLPLGQVVQAIDGDAVFTSCALGRHECSDSFPCPGHYVFKPIRDQLTGLMTTTTIEDLAIGIRIGMAHLNGEVNTY
ncbi:Rrf2 family transcriptional regulator [Algoriphagus jejuensis]